MRPELPVHQSALTLGEDTVEASVAGRALEPIAKRELTRKLRDGEIRDMLLRSPHFRTVAKAFRASETSFGMTTWSPLLGTSKGHMIHQIRDYSLLFQLLVRHERQRGASYQRVIFSRLELEWL